MILPRHVCNSFPFHLSYRSFFEFEIMIVFKTPEPSLSDHRHDSLEWTLSSTNAKELEVELGL